MVSRRTMETILTIALAYGNIKPTDDIAGARHHRDGYGIMELNIPHKNELPEDIAARLEDDEYVYWDDEEQIWFAL